MYIIMVCNDPPGLPEALLPPSMYKSVNLEKLPMMFVIIRKENVLVMLGIVM